MSGTGSGNGLEMKKIKNTAFPAQEIFHLASEQESLKREYCL
jgi:hypothetical protein